MNVARIVTLLFGMENGLKAMTMGFVTLRTIYVVAVAEFIWNLRKSRLNT